MATVQAGYEPRMVLMSAVATVWGIRLTYNFSRHGGYSWKFWSGNEDYRWAHVRQKPGLNTRLGWTVFHFGFICLYQNALLLLIALPVVLVQGTGAPTLVVARLAALDVGLVLLETVADQQQWNFQGEKKRRIKVVARYQQYQAANLIVQRVLACKTVADGRKALILSAVIILPMFLIFLLVRFANRVLRREEEAAADPVEVELLRAKIGRLEAGTPFHRARSRR